ncbi:hypothetical protein EIN_125680 [Entamoeba invadens IP1]|uniref:Uncharacterized protein n=1 Tax=Entamoeba invadens IP1 TaxID=370355 RepID=A0A0A1U518_ENTIV|nr:hypothetical protein EIN_125680 [Entamoeba invadens IP1]ELP89384.1 hypothetical protein EIN_125680 [Entamoeba invadens IP1]|eukprot:XP_004256155.1 hypothetical protein EIN_125680 [Entamoeba invadens IP1]
MEKCEHQKCRKEKQKAEKQRIKNEKKLETDFAEFKKTLTSEQQTLLDEYIKYETEKDQSYSSDVDEGSDKDDDKCKRRHEKCPMDKKRRQMKRMWKWHMMNQMYNRLPPPPMCCPPPQFGYDQMGCGFGIRPFHQPYYGCCPPSPPMMGLNPYGCNQMCFPPPPPFFGRFGGWERGRRHHPQL